MSVDVEGIGKMVNGYARFQIPSLELRRNRRVLAVLDMHEPERGRVLDVVADAEVLAVRRRRRVAYEPVRPISIPSPISFNLNLR